MSADRHAPPKPHDTGALFVSDRELHLRVCPSLGWDTFRAVLKAWERDGFPKIMSLTRSRYWPAAKAWLDSHYRADKTSLVSENVQDGPENFGGD
jgi:hypothetical protein